MGKNSEKNSSWKKFHVGNENEFCKLSNNNNESKCQNLKCFVSSAEVEWITSHLLFQAYEKATQEWPRNNPSFNAYMTTCNSLYEEALQSLQNPPPPREFMGK